MDIAERNRLRAEAHLPLLDVTAETERLQKIKSRVRRGMGKTKAGIRRVDRQRTRLDRQDGPVVYFAAAGR
jgi:hypothetical protein